LSSNPANTLWQTNYTFGWPRHPYACGALHAASIAWEQQEKFNIGQRYENVLIELFISMQNEWFTTGLKVGLIFLIICEIYLIESLKIGHRFLGCSTSQISNGKRTKVY